MEGISVNGEKYVKASEIARELGYTSDYVGQLCRARQISAKLVGRSWYVSEQSLRDHKKSRYRSTNAKTKSEVKKTLKSLESFTTSDFYSRVRPKNAREDNYYEKDDNDIIPTLQKPERANFDNEEVSHVKVHLEDRKNKAESQVQIEKVEKISQGKAKSPTVNIKHSTNSAKISILSTKNNRINTQKPLIKSSKTNKIRNNTESSSVTATLIKVFAFTFILITICMLGVALVALEGTTSYVDGKVSTQYSFNFSKFNLK